MKSFTEWLNVREANAQLVMPGQQPGQQPVDANKVRMDYYDKAAAAGTVTPEMTAIYQQNMGNKKLISQLNKINVMLKNGQLKPAPGAAKVAAVATPGAAPPNAQQPAPQQSELLRQRVAMQKQLQKGPEQVGAARMRQGQF